MKKVKQITRYVWKDVFNPLEVNQSATYPLKGVQRSRLYGAACDYGRAYGKKFTIRTTEKAFTVTRVS